MAQPVLRYLLAGCLHHAKWSARCQRPVSYTHLILFEERLLLESLTLDTYFMDTTVMDALTIQGYLPDAKDSMLRVINRLLS